MKGSKMNRDQMTRLENYEKMYQSVQLGYEDAISQMTQLKSKGKTKSVTYKQLMAQKLTYKNMLSMYKLFGIDD